MCRLFLNHLADGATLVARDGSAIIAMYVDGRTDRDYVAAPHDHTRRPYYFRLAKVHVL